MTFPQQHQSCRKDGTCRKLTNARYNRLPARHKSWFGKTVDFLTKKTQTPGLFFCGVESGICSVGFCPKIRKVE